MLTSNATAPKKTPDRAFRPESHVGVGLGGWGAGELGAGKLGAGELGSSEMWSWKLVSWGAGELGPTLTHSSGVPPRATPDEPPSAAAMLLLNIYQLLNLWAKPFYSLLCKGMQSLSVCTREPLAGSRIFTHAPQPHVHP